MEHSANMRRPVSSTATPRACRTERGVVRLLASLDYRLLTEFPLPDGRRVDIAAIDPQGGFAIVEVKSSVADFRADGKWCFYRGYCDAFYFAVDPAFPHEMLPADVGVIVADAFEAALLRPAPVTALNAARRRALMLRFARTAAARLAALTDCAVGQAESGW
jgi:hypothetical protein